MPENPSRRLDRAKNAPIERREVLRLMRPTAAAGAGLPPLTQSLTQFASAQDSVARRRSSPARATT